jgi:hypothetical protein
MLRVPRRDLNLLDEIRTPAFPLRYQSVQVIDIYVAHPGSKVAALVLGQMEHETIPRHLHINRKGRLESKLPVDREPKPLNVKGLRFLVAIYAQNRNGTLHMYSLDISNV